LVGEGVEGKMPVSVFVCIHVLCFVPRTEKTFTLLLSEKNRKGELQGTPAGALLLGATLGQGEFWFGWCFLSLSQLLFPCGFPLLQMTG